MSSGPNPSPPRHTAGIPAWKGMALWAALVAATPLCVVVAYAVAELARYDGVCGPYAPDVAAFPCDFESYARNVFSPFATAGLVVVAAVATVAAAGFWGVALSVAWVVLRRPPGQRG